MASTRILIVEDESIIAMTMRNILQDLGYTVVDAVASGKEALQAVQRQEIDLILMDIHIDGDMDGIETAREIYLQQDIPIVFLTSYADDRTIARAENTRSYGYILKPFKERELKATIQIALSNHKQEMSIQASLERLRAKNLEESQFIAAIAHEFRTPLTSISLAAEVLQDFGDRLSLEKKQRRFDGIHQAIERMNQLLDEALLLSQLNSEPIHAYLQLIDLEVFGRKLIDEFQLYAGEHHTLSYNYAQELQDNASKASEVILNEKLLRPVLSNLLTNAIKYSPAGGSIHLRIVHEPQQIEFRVCDQGIGIPPEFQEIVFQRFVRAHNVGKIKGTGLGLSIAKHLVELQCGTISISSLPSETTTFIVTLPLPVKLQSKLTDG
jgi:signal transduction histidine kinase